MGREYADYRDNLAFIAELYPQRATLKLQEVSELLGCNYRTLQADSEFPTVRTGKTYNVPVVGLAKWLSRYAK